jgi:hypothetical protein
MKISLVSLIRAIPLGALLFVVIGCQNQNEKAELAKLKVQSALEETNKALVRQLMDGFNRKDPQVYDKYYAPSCVFYFPSSVQKPNSRKEDMEASMKIWGAFPDMQWIPENIL